MEPEQAITGEPKRQPWLLRVLFENRITMHWYIVRTGLISLVPSLAIAFVLAMSGIITEDTSPRFEGPALELIIMIVVVGPPIETLLMGCGLWALSFITKRRVPLAAMSAFVWAVLHSLMAPAWGLAVLWPFFVFSCSYLAWRQRAWWRAILVTSCVHAFQNVLPAVVAVASQ